MYHLNSLDCHMHVMYSKVYQMEQHSGDWESVSLIIKECNINDFNTCTWTFNEPARAYRAYSTNNIVSHYLNVVGVTYSVVGGLIWEKSSFSSLMNQFPYFHLISFAVFPNVKYSCNILKNQIDRFFTNKFIFRVLNSKPQELHSIIYNSLASEMEFCAFYSTL